jgi:hypothetical protein
MKRAGNKDSKRREMRSITNVHPFEGMEIASGGDAVEAARTGNDELGSNQPLDSFLDLSKRIGEKVTRVSDPLFDRLLGGEDLPFDLGLKQLR